MDCSPFIRRVFLIGKEFSSIATEQEKWFGTKYNKERLSLDLINKCLKCELDPNLHLPKPNEFIPTDFQLYSGDKKDDYPQTPIKIQVRYLNC